MVGHQRQHVGRGSFGAILHAELDGFKIFNGLWENILSNLTSSVGVENANVEDGRILAAKLVLTVVFGNSEGLRMDGPVQVLLLCVLGDVSEK